MTVIRKIRSSGLKIPEISAKDATEVLYSHKAEVNDLYSVTAMCDVYVGSLYEWVGCCPGRDPVPG